MPPSTTTEKRLQPRKTPRQPRSVETRARILEAAKRVFAAHGYAAGTTNRIAEEAGLSVGSLYQYFPNKDAILVELVRDHIEEGTHHVLAAIVDAGDDLDALLRAAIDAMVQTHEADRQLHRVLFEESPRPRSLLDELRQLEDGLVDALAPRLAAERPTLPDPHLAARITVTTIESLVHRLVATDRPLDRDQFVDETVRLVVGYVGADDRRSP